MNKLRKLQHEFQNYLLGDDSEQLIIKRVKSTPQRTAEQRMLFYGNAYILRLKEALSSDYERLHSYLGDELFDTLMLQYIKHYPSKHPSLRYFGQYMVQLVKQLEPFKSLVEVAEIASIEQAFANSFDAADCHCVTQQQLAQLAPEAWATLSLKFHDSVQLLPQRYNSFQIWQALDKAQAPPQKMPDKCTWLIWRHNLVSHYRALENAELSALITAKTTGSFASVCEALLEHFSEEETPMRAVGYLQQWINEQMVCEIN